MSLNSPIWIGITIVAVAMLIYGVQLGMRNTRPKARCNHCGSQNMREIRREPVGTRTVESVGGGTPAGGDVRMQLDYKVTYHCNHCHKESIFTIPKTF